jgi:hypothetical protein
MMHKIRTRLLTIFNPRGSFKLSHGDLFSRSLGIDDRNCDTPTWRASLLSTHLLLAVLLTVLLMALSPAVADAAPKDVVTPAVQPMFGRMFPDLPAYDGPSDNALTALTCGQAPLSSVCYLQTLVPTAYSPTINGSPSASAAMGPMFDQNIAAPTIRPTTDPSGSGNDDNSVYPGPGFLPDPSKDVPSFFTYFGQFLDHDMTLDTLPQPTEFVDPNTIPNHRDPRLNLDSVYGGGPNANPELYEADKKHLKVNGRDLPRDPSCVVPGLAVSSLTPCPAIIIEGRNDENQVIAQVHVAFLRAHNALIDQGYNLEQARELMRWRHQWIVVHEFLPEVLDANVYADVFRPDGIHTKYYDPKQAFRAVMPVEFSVAAYRFGHSQVRKAYIMTQNGAKLQVFNNNNVQDLHGGRQIATDHTIFWPNFLPVDNQPSTGQAGTGQVAANIGRKVDTLLSSGLFGLPIPGAEPEGSSILAKRNLQRGREYGLPSGQKVAARLQLDDPSIHVYTNAEIAAAIPRLGFLGLNAPNYDGSYLGETPLWLYILAESKIVHNGTKIGPVGSRIIAEVIGGLLAGDVRSYYRRGWTPDGGVFRAQDLLREAGVLP